jgi:D-alanyl-D-alanine carboxypeptidase/D-alanyl-D-alanine-endopeptidase (penicillin-binding protein 4)
VVDDNTFRVVATPAETAGLPALFRVEPDLPSLRIDWRVVTSTNRKHAVAYARDPGSAGMRFTGRIPLASKPWTPELAVADPVRHFGEALRDALVRRGIEFAGDIRVSHSTNGLPAVELMSWTSEPLEVRLRRCMKPSQNLHAQLLLALVGADVARLSGDITNDVAVLGLQPMRTLLASAGIPEAAVRLEEGSGLSRSNAVTPSATVQLLRFFQKHPQREAWMASLPVGGVDGTLRNRFRKGPATGNVRAKTGGLRGVAALAGHVTTAAGDEVLFAIYANEAPDGAEARSRIDRWVELIAAHPSRF